MPRKIFKIILCFSFLLYLPVQASELVLPQVGAQIALSQPFNPIILTGIKVNPHDPFKVDFILDTGNFVETPFMASHTSLQNESKKLIKYFLASLTTPEADMWVNLSPYEKDRIVPESFGQTEMGRDVLAQDYILKQLTASLMYPENDTGKKFWQKVYESTPHKNVTVNTFNKVWVVPDKVVIYENAANNTAYIVASSLKVLTEQDYLATNKNLSFPSASILSNRVLPKVVGNPETYKSGPPIKTFEGDKKASQIVRDIVIPLLTKEINEGTHFTQLRQVYHSLILATWYKAKMQQSILAKTYVNQNKTAGIAIDDPEEMQKIYARYLESFKKGAYNYIKEEVDPVSKKILPRKYFAGGVTLNVSQAMTSTRVEPKESNSSVVVTARLNRIKRATRAHETRPRIRRTNNEAKLLHLKIKTLLDSRTYTAKQISEMLNMPLRTIDSYIYIHGDLSNHPNLIRRFVRTRQQMRTAVKRVRLILSKGPNTIKQISEKINFSVMDTWNLINNRSDLRDHPHLIRIQQSVDRAQSVAFPSGGRMQSSLTKYDLEFMMKNPEKYYVTIASAGYAKPAPIRVKWDYIDTSIDQLDMRYDILETVERLYQQRVNKLDPIIILDWGAGNGMGVMGLNHALKKRKIPHHIYALSGNYFSEWQWSTEDVTFILDDGSNLLKHLGKLSIDFVYSHMGLTHFLNQSEYHQIQYGMPQDIMKDLFAMIKPGGIIRMAEFSDVVLKKEYDFIRKFITRVSDGGYKYVEYRNVFDSAQLAKGGIDLNPSKIDLSLQNNGQEIQLSMDQEGNEQNLNTAGFLPVIINIAPMVNLSRFLNNK